MTRSAVRFPVYYDHCYPAALKRVFEEAGFTRVQIEVCWAQPGYFEGVFPLFIVTSLYETVIRKLRLSTLASYMIVAADR